MTTELTITGYDTPEEKRAIDGAISILKTMGMLVKFPKEDCENFVRACAVMKLNPILKQVYPVPYWNSELKRETLGIIPDYKTFLVRAEKSGKLDGWQTEFEGEIVKKSITKKSMKKDGSWREYVAEVIDKPKTTLRGRIIIWRKDHSRPHVSRWLRLVDEMKDTPFWHDDGEGMLEKNLIREYFDKIFPKDCDLVDYSKEVQASEYEVLDDADNTTKAIENTPKAVPIEIANAYKKANRIMGEFSMVSSLKEEYDKNLKDAYNAGDIGKLESLIAELESRKRAAEDAAKSHRKPKPDQAEPIIDAEIIPEEKPQDKQKEDGNANLNKVRYDIIKGLNILAKYKIDRFDQPSRKAKSMKYHLGVENLAECTDIPKLESYLTHLRQVYKDKDLITKARAVIDALPDGEKKDRAELCFNEALLTGSGYELIIETDWINLKDGEEENEKADF